jgi:hypothetical protein
MSFTNKQKYNQKHGFTLNKAHSLEDIAKTTKIKKSILQEIFNRGSGAYETNPQSVRLKSGKKDPKAPLSRKMSKQQWSYSRVYGFIMQNPKQVNKGQPDHDLAIKAGLLKK